MDNASEFIQIFKELECWMRVKIAKSGYSDFPSMLSELRGTNRQIHNNFNFLKKMGALRNVITHEKTVIAQPSGDVVCTFKKLTEFIMEPPKLLQHCTKNPSTLSKEILLPAVLHHMCEKDYSQVIVQDNGEYRLLSREGISKWVEANIETDNVSIKKTKVADVLTHEDEKSCEYVDESTDVFTFLDIVSSPNKRFQAVIITKHGKSKEKPIGIATVWDAGEIVKKLNLA